jgi:hypothetical protein
MKFLVTTVFLFSFYASAETCMMLKKPMMIDEATGHRKPAEASLCDISDSCINGRGIEEPKYCFIGRKKMADVKVIGTTEQALRALGIFGGQEFVKICIDGVYMETNGKRVYYAAQVLRNDRAYLKRAICRSDMVDPHDPHFEIH